ncbi:MAG: PmoA family protein [Opitutaceae bacterium]|nr:PmoA family protein [Opitutaceae bacterium]
MNRYFPLALFIVAACTLAAAAPGRPLVLREDPAAQTISVLRAGEATPLLTQNAGAGMRPYVHPLVAPDGNGLLTELAPSHHRHQTGLYWGLTRLNGRDYFHNSGADYWRRVGSRIIAGQGEEVTWVTEYHLLGADGQPVMLETQRWSMRDLGTRYLIELEWTGAALADLTIDEYAYGGLFLRMPWRSGMPGGVVNSNRQRNERANGQRAVWVDVGLQVEGRTDLAHVAILDHPLNPGYPSAWRVDGQLGVGPSRSIQGAWKIARGQSATFRHQFVVYTGEFNDLQVDQAWRDYTGERLDNVMWNLAREEGKRAKFLTGEEAVAKMTVVDGFEVKLTAAEPMITQPMAFCWDDRGRLWIAENRDYENRRAGFANAGDSRILILEDTDGDGKMDTRKVFLEGIPFPAAIAVGFDGLWLGAPPNLLFVPDRDRDDRADMDKVEIRLTGWGIQDRHETLNSLTWGPDGWLYGCQGYATRSNVGKPADGGRLYKKGEPFPENIAVRDPQYIDGGVWRYHPTKDRFEIVAHGFSNPWGLDFDDHGQMFITACVIPHLWHVIPGGIYHRQGGRHINPYVYDDIKTIADHRHRSAHGGARIYLADEFPRHYRDRIFMANLHEHALLTDILEPRGSGFVGRHGDDAVLANDPMWIGFSTEVGPDGAVYILDWHDADICGNSVNDKGTGRIFRFAPRGLPGKAGLNLAALNDLELVELQTHRNDWYVRRARLQLQQRAAAGRLDGRVAERLWELFRRGESPARKLRALWALHVTKNLPPEKLQPLLGDPAPYVRGWAIELLGEDGSPGPAVVNTFAQMAATDASPVVRRFLASVLQRLPLDQRWAVAQGLSRRGEDADDHNVPKLVWFGVEPLVAADPARALDLAVRAEIPLLTQFIARRATAAKQLEAVARVLASAPPLAVREGLLQGVRDGLSGVGRREITAPANWAAAEAAVLAGANDRTRELVLQLGQRFGDAKASAAQLATLRDKSADVARRREILAEFARDGYAPAVPAVIALLDEAPLRRDALRAAAAFEDNRLPAEILRRYATWPAADKAEAILTLAARRPTAERLFAALRQQTIPKAEVSAFAARQLQRVLGPAFIDFWGPIAQPDQAKQTEMAALKRRLSDEVLARASLANGRGVFERTCAPCHTLYGTGGNLGPDLTGSNRANLDYILTEIINPSEVMQDGYHLVTITTRDGRTLAGNLAAEDDQQVTLRMVGQDTTVAKSEIQSREKSAVSLMPEGLLKTLSNDEVRDLIAYLRTTKQVPPAGQ